MLKITIIGNVGNDATIKDTNGNKFASFSIAVNEGYKNKDGQKVEKTTWVNCILNNAAHGAIPYIKKGGKIYVEGSLKVGKYKDQNQETQVQITCNVSQLELLSAATPTNNEANNNNNSGLPE